MGFFQIAHMEHMIEHETNPLKEEKQLLREINTLRKLRDQISSNVCPADEVNQAFGQIEPMEMQLKVCVSLLFLNEQAVCRFH